MSKTVKYITAIILIILTAFTPYGIVPSEVSASAASLSDLNKESVFLKQKTSVTCTLSSAAMLMRRTAICAGMENWEEITEENIRPVGWTNGIGLRWNFTYNNITIGHGYFSGEDNKLEILNLLEQYPQGFVIYNAGNEEQTHAVFLCDYDSENDIFYVADPATNAPEGRIPLTESTIKGETQEDRINNLDAYWYAVSPVVSVEDGNFTAPEIPTDPPEETGDTVSFNKTKKDVKSYYVVSDDSAQGAALRYYPSGSSSEYKRIGKGTILFIDSVGNNNFGAKWYKTDSGYYIFSNNLTSFDEYSAEITKFNNTAEELGATYCVKSKDGTAVPLRLEPSEGNNIVAKLENGTKLYIESSGVNSVGAKWFRTQEGYYIKASRTEFVSDNKLDGADYTGQLSSVTGEYKSEPVEDENQAVEIEPVEYRITASALYVRKSAVDGDKLGMLPKGAVVSVTAILSGWGRIDFEGSEGWISLQYAEKITNVQTPVKLEYVKLSTDMLQVGSAVTCSVGLTSDVVCMYRFFVYNDKGEEVFRHTNVQAKNEFSYKPDNAGVYYFFIEITTADGRTLSAYSGNFTVHSKLQLDSVTSNTDDFVFVGEQIVWNVKASSISESSVYKYALYADDNLVCERESLSPTFVYTPEKGGNYTLRVYLEDSFSSSEEIVSDNVRVLWELSLDFIKLSTTDIVTGQEVTCTVTVNGGSGDYLYCFSVFKDEKVVRRGSYIEENNTSLTFDEEGEYRILCAVRDSRQTIVSSFSDPITVVSVRDGDVNNDGFITAGDARLILRHSAGLEKLADRFLNAADVNKDGRINAFDARGALRRAANLD